MARNRSKRLVYYGFADASFAETNARALRIDTDQLRILIAHGQIASVLLEWFADGFEG